MLKSRTEFLDISEKDEYSGAIKRMLNVTRKFSQKLEAMKRISR